MATSIRLASDPSALQFHLKVATGQEGPLVHGSVLLSVGLRAPYAMSQFRLPHPGPATALRAELLRGEYKAS